MIVTTIAIGDSPVAHIYILSPSRRSSFMFCSVLDLTSSILFHFGSTFPCDFNPYYE